MQKPNTEKQHLKSYHWEQCKIDADIIQNILHEKVTYRNLE